MSRKLTAFRVANITPQTTCNYAVLIPSVWRSLLAVESASMPFRKTTAASIYIRGIEYKIPVKQTGQGTWTCTMVENLFMGSLYQSLNQYYRNAGGDISDYSSFSTFSLNNIYIFITDALTGTAPVAACVLKDCYLTDVSEISLNASGATDVMKVKLAFQYNDILDPIKMANNLTGQKFTLNDGGKKSIQAIEAGVAGITAAAWGVNWAVKKGVDEIEELLKGE